MIEHFYMVVLHLQSSGMSPLLSSELYCHIHGEWLLQFTLGKITLLGHGLVYSVTFILSGLIRRPHPLTSKSNLVNKVKFLWLAHGFCEL